MKQIESVKTNAKRKMLQKLPNITNNCVCHCLKMIFSAAATSIAAYPKWAYHYTLGQVQ